MPIPPLKFGRFLRLALDPALSPAQLLEVRDKVQAAKCQIFRGGAQGPPLVRILFSSRCRARRQSSRRRRGAGWIRGPVGASNHQAIDHCAHAIHSANAGFKQASFCFARDPASQGHHAVIGGHLHARECLRRKPASGSDSPRTCSWAAHQKLRPNLLSQGDIGGGHSSCRPRQRCGSRDAAFAGDTGGHIGRRPSPGRCDSPGRSNTGDNFTTCSADAWAHSANSAGVSSHTCADSRARTDASACPDSGSRRPETWGSDGRAGSNPWI